MKYTYSEIRSFSPIFSCILERSFAEIVCMPLSPFLSKLFLQKNISPNTITLFMIIAGVMGNLFLMYPSWEIKSIGAFFLYLWFVLDCSDGEVARISKQFSKYGKEMDYMAHLTCHPLLMIAIWVTYYQMGVKMMNYISLICLIFISGELVNRNLIMFITYLEEKRSRIQKSSHLVCIVRYCLIQPLYFPNFVIVFPVILVLHYMSMSNSLYVFIVWFSYYALYCIYAVLKNILFFYKS